MAQKNSQKLRIGIVGAGRIVRDRHLPALKKDRAESLRDYVSSFYKTIDSPTSLREWLINPCRKYADRGSRIVDRGL